MRALAISPDGKRAVSGSFDTSAIRWSLDAQRRRAGAALPRRRGERGRLSEGRPHRHRRRGCAHRDLDAGQAEPDSGARRPHRADRRPRGVARRRDARLGVVGSHACGCGRSPAARRACSKATRRTSTASRSRRTAARWSAPATTRRCASGRSRTAARTVRNLPTPLNAVAVAPDGEIVAAGADGKVYFLSPQGETARRDRGRARRRSSRSRFRRDGKLIAAAGIRGSVAIIDRKTRKIAHTLVGPGPAGLVGRVLPRQPHAADRRHRPHDPALECVTGEPIDVVVVGAPDDPLAAYAGDPRRARCFAPASPATR